jgi:hypothetical protein
MVIKKQGYNSMQTKEWIGPGGCHGASQAYDVVHYLDDSLLDDFFFYVKKLYHRTISHLFSRVDDIRGQKDNMCAVKKTANNFCVRILESILRACLTALVKGPNPQNNRHLWVVAKKSAQIGTLKRREW